MGSRHDCKNNRGNAKAKSNHGENGSKSQPRFLGFIQFRLDPQFVRSSLQLLQGACDNLAHSEKIVFQLLDSLFGPSALGMGLSFAKCCDDTACGCYQRGERFDDGYDLDGHIFISAQR
jgi:hypothetical protein